MFRKLYAGLSALVPPAMLAFALWHWYKINWNFALTFNEVGYIALAIFGFLGMYLRFVSS